MKNTMNLFEIYDYIRKLEKQIKRLSIKLNYRNRRK